MTDTWRCSPRFCDDCGCVNGIHGTCETRGCGPDCDGVHTFYFCSCDCCKEDTDE